MKNFLISLLIFIMLINIITPAFAAEISRPEINGQFLLIYRPPIEHSATSAASVSESEQISVNFSDLIQDYGSFTSTELLKIPENTMNIEPSETNIAYQIAYDYSKQNISENKNLYSSVASKASPAVIGEVRTFSAEHTVTGADYTFDATCLYTSSCSEVFVENTIEYSTNSAEDKSLKTEMATLVGKEFTNSIQPYMLEHLTEYTGMYGNKNGKIVILLQDIKDNYGINGNLGYTAGYYSIGTKILHIDTYPLMSQGLNIAPTEEGVANAFPTIAHEFTHMLEKGITKNSPYWFSELLAIASEASLFPEETADNEFINYGADIGNVKNGAVLNYTDYSVNDYSVGANYGLLYMFQNYLRNQTETGGVTYVFERLILNSLTSSSYEEATVQALNETLNSNEYSFTDFNDLLESFYIAFTLKEDTGKYKFSGIGKVEHTTTLFPTSDELYFYPGTAVVMPLYGEDFEVPNNALKYVAFSYSENDATKISSVIYPDEYHDILINHDYLEQTGHRVYSIVQPTLSLNGIYNISNNSSVLKKLYRGVRFIPLSDAIFAMDNDTFTLFYSLPDKEVNIPFVCQSINERNKYDIVTLKFDPKSTVGINSYAHDTLYNSANKMLTIYPQVYFGKSYENLCACLAIYDAESDILIEKKLLDLPAYPFKANTIEVYQFTVPVNNSPSGEYKIKFFIWDKSENLFPLSYSYELYFSE